MKKTNGSSVTISVSAKQAATIAVGAVATLGSSVVGTVAPSSRLNTSVINHSGGAFNNQNMPRAYGDSGGDGANTKTARDSLASLFAVTPLERRLAAQGDLGDYWYHRYLQGDPVAKIGLAMWGNAFERSLVGPYWDLLGAAALWDLRRGIEASGQQLTAAFLHSIGRALALANDRAISLDIKYRIGDVSGLLSAQQITQYHQRVFEDFGISPSYFGGTPFWGYVWESQYTSRMWCQTCDPSDASGGN